MEGPVVPHARVADAPLQRQGPQLLGPVLSASGPKARRNRGAEPGGFLVSRKEANKKGTLRKIGPWGLRNNQRGPHKVSGGNALLPFPKNVSTADQMEALFGAKAFTSGQGMDLSWCPFQTTFTFKQGSLKHTHTPHTHTHAHILEI